jgi:hypothetical protein
MAIVEFTKDCDLYCKGDRIELSKEEQKDVGALAEQREVSNPYKVVEDPKILKPPTQLKLMKSRQANASSRSFRRMPRTQISPLPASKPRPPLRINERKSRLKDQIAADASTQHTTPAKQPGRRMLIALIWGYQTRRTEIPCRLHHQVTACRRTRSDHGT